MRRIGYGSKVAAWLLAAAAAGAIWGGSPAEAANGSCMANYTRYIPSEPGQFYATGFFNSYHVPGAMGSTGYTIPGTWEVGGPQPTFPHRTAAGYDIPKSSFTVREYVDKKAYPTAYREGFTTSTKAEVWKVPAGTHSGWWYISLHPYFLGTGQPPYYNGYSYTRTYMHTDGVAQNFPFGFVNSRITPDSQALPNWAGQVPSDPQQHAIRFVIKSYFHRNLKDFNSSYSPDINVPDSEVDAAAVANTATLTQETVSRLLDYIHAKNVERPYLDLKSGVTIRDEGWTNSPSIRMVDNGSIPYECAFFAEIVKHPRLLDVYMLKYFIRTQSIVGLAPFQFNNDGGTIIAYAPYRLHITTPPPPANKTPVLQPDSVQTDHRKSVAINVLANDSDPDGGPQPLRVTSVTTPSRGSLTWTASGTLVYTPQPGYEGQVTVTYSATDGAASSSTVAIFESKICREQVLVPGGMTCTGGQRYGSADFADSCTYSPDRYELQEVSCP